jgi:hypothetical protein
VVVARKVVRAGTDPNLHTPARCRLGDCEFGRQEERMAQRGVHDVHAESDAASPPRHGSKQGRGVPGPVAMGEELT